MVCCQSIMKHDKTDKVMRRRPTPCRPQYRHSPYIPRQRSTRDKPRCDTVKDTRCRPCARGREVFKKSISTIGNHQGSEHTRLAVRRSCLNTRPSDVPTAGEAGQDQGRNCFRRNLECHQRSSHRYSVARITSGCCCQASHSMVELARHGIVP